MGKELVEGCKPAEIHLLSISELNQMDKGLCLGCRCALAICRDFSLSCASRVTAPLGSSCGSEFQANP
eukprot:264836-Prorocentrum_minimum.AAC.1